MEKIETEDNTLEIVINLLTTFTPIDEIKLKLKEFKVRNSTQLIQKALKIMIGNVVDETKYASDYYILTLKYLISKCLEMNKYADALAGLKELRSYLNLQGSATSSEADIVVKII
jgi:hypothetical protein